MADPEKLFQARLEQLIRRKYPSLDRFWLEKEVSKGYVSLVLRGHRSPSIRTLTKIAKALGVELKAFFIFPERSEKDRAMDLLQTAEAETVRRVLRLLEDERK